MRAFARRKSTIAFVMALPLMLTIALSKGRILDDTLPLLAAAGIVPTENPDKSRKLIIPTTLDDVRLLIVRATDQQG